VAWLSDERRRWYLLAVGWVVLIVLGFTGFLAQSTGPGVERTLLDNLYLTLQLAVLSYGGSDGDLNWRLEVARFAAPLMAMGTLFQAASVVFREQFERYRLSGFRGHTVVCGLGAAGTRLALSLAQAGRPVVGVDQDVVKADAIAIAVCHLARRAVRLVAAQGAPAAALARLRPARRDHRGCP